MEMAYFCIKIVGSICVMISSVTWGWKAGNVIEKRYGELKEIHRSFHMIYGDISCGTTSFVEIIWHVGEQSTENFRKFYRYIENEMNHKSKRKFSDIWLEGIEIHLQGIHIEEQDISELKRVGMNLGSVDRELQLSMIQLYLKKLEYRIEELEKDKEQKIKLYRTLGTLGGIFTVIILL